MTAYAQAVSPWDAVTPNETGFSDLADQLRQHSEASLEHYLEPRLAQMIPEIIALSLDAAVPTIQVDQKTVAAAIDFASLLPRLAPLPEVSTDPDGEISFDWFGPSGKMFSVSVNKSRRLSYAGWFGENSRIHGTETLVASFPEEIRLGLLRATQ
jgi:hypothetical protein